MQMLRNALFSLSLVSAVSFGVGCRRESDSSAQSNATLSAPISVSLLPLARVKGFTCSQVDSGAVINAKVAKQDGSSDESVTLIRLAMGQFTEANGAPVTSCSSHATTLGQWLTQAVVGNAGPGSTSAPLTWTLESSTKSREIWLANGTQRLSIGKLAISSSGVGISMNEMG